MVSGQLPAFTPKSLSPALIKPAPMAKTTVLPASAMKSPKRSMAGVQPPNWTQLPGSASAAAAAPDGSLWVLSDQPAGADKYIWHYSNGAWTNISGLADHLSVGLDGTLYAINSGGGTWAYSNGTWTALGGGAIALSAAADGSVYVLSNAGSGDRAIWKNTNGVWTQEPGAGIAIAASWDAVSYSISGVGSIQPYGLWVLNSSGSIYHLNTDGTYAQLPGAASAIAPTLGGGVFVLGYPPSSSGEAIYYYAFPGWTAEPGSAVSLSCSSTHLYAIAASGAIFSTPIVNVYSNTALPPFTMQTIGPRDGFQPYYDIYGSGKMQAIAANPSNPQTVYVAGGYGADDPITNDTGVYGTTDGGATWTALNSGLTDTIVNGLWLDPNNPSVLLAATAYGGIFRSTNAGVTWTNAENSWGATQIIASGAVLYAATYGGILVSTDDGATWSQSVSTTNEALSVAASNGAVYAGLSDGTVLALKTGTWNTVGHFAASVRQLAADAVNPLQLYAVVGTYAGALYTSVDGGATWTKSSEPTLAGAVIVTADPTISGTVYAAAGDGYVEVSTNFGSTWTPTSIGGDQRGLTILPGNPETFLDGSDQGIQSCAGPDKCSQISTALSTNIVNSVTAEGSTVVAAMQDFPPASTQDGGATWTTALGFQEDGTLLLNPDRTGYCYGFDAEGFKLSTDFCKTFASVATVPLPSQNPLIGGELIAVDHTNPSKVYVTDLTAVYASTDHGQTFAATSWPYSDDYYGYKSAIAVSPINGSHIMLMGAGGLSVTFDGGNTWKASTAGGSAMLPYYPVGLAISPTDDNMVFAIAGALLYRSTDGGLTFTQIATPSAANAQLSARSALVSHTISPMLRELYKRNPLAAILESQPVRYAPIPTFIAFDQKGAPPYLAMATTDGLFISTDYGNDWQIASGGTVTSLYYSAAWDQGILYGGSWGNGILKSSIILQ